MEKTKVPHLNLRIAKVRGAREDIERYAGRHLFTPTYSEVIRRVIEYSENYVFTDRSKESKLVS